MEELSKIPVLKHGVENLKTLLLHKLPYLIEQNLTVKLNLVNTREEILKEKSHYFKPIINIDLI